MTFGQDRPALRSNEPPPPKLPLRTRSRGSTAFLAFAVAVIAIGLGLHFYGLIPQAEQRSTASKKTAPQQLASVKVVPANPIVTAPPSVIDETTRQEIADLEQKLRYQSEEFQRLLDEAKQMPASKAVQTAQARPAAPPPLVVKVKQSVAANQDEAEESVEHIPPRRVEVQPQRLIRLDDDPPMKPIRLE